jgi:hypothetical protein
MPTDNMSKLEHLQMIISMEAGAIALIIASKRGLNAPQLIKSRQALREACVMIDDILNAHYASIKKVPKL